MFLEKEMKNDWMKFAGAGALALVVAAGCTGADQTGDGQTADSPAAAKMQNGVDKMQGGAKDAAGAAGNTVTNAAGNVANGAANVANSAAKGVVNVANSAANVASKGTQAVVNGANKAMGSAKNLDDATTITPMLKTAIGANAAMKGSNINVSTNDKTVMLDGSVKSPAQKTMAGNMAKQKAPGYKVMNNLKVIK